MNADFFSQRVGVGKFFEANRLSKLHNFSVNVATGCKGVAHRD